MVRSIGAFVEPAGFPLALDEAARALSKGDGLVQGSNFPFGETRYQSRENFGGDQTVAERRMPAANIDAESLGDGRQAEAWRGRLQGCGRR